MDPRADRRTHAAAGLAGGLGVAAAPPPGDRDDEAGAAGYVATRERLRHYFDRTAAGAWERLTSEAPVSRIRRTVREGRAAMRAALLSRLPDDMTGMRALDAGCGPGDLAVALARRGADVVGVDLSGSLLDVARLRMPVDLASRVRFERGDMLVERGRFDVTVAMDSLIHYEIGDVAGALSALAPRSAVTLFTVAPRTPLLAAMHLVGRALPAGDRAPRIAPHSDRALARALAPHGLTPRAVARIHRGFYVSGAWEVAP